jgi:hypothetical protein
MAPPISISSGATERLASLWRQWLWSVNHRLPSRIWSVACILSWNATDQQNPQSQTCVNSFLARLSNRSHSLRCTRVNRGNLGIRKTNPITELGLWAFQDKQWQYLGSWNRHKAELVTWHWQSPIYTWRKWRYRKNGSCLISYHRIRRKTFHVLDRELYWSGVKFQSNDDSGWGFKIVTLYGVSLCHFTRAAWLSILW